MKANEIQIGDWVKLMNPKGECIDYVKIDANLFGIFLRDGEEGFVRFEPIPLTPEILEKNGWKEAQFWHEYQDEKNTIQSCLPDMRGIINGVEIQHFKCEYVHQYQHLLCLCGLNDLADNFKI